MGLLDNIFRLTQRAKGNISSFDLKSTGQVFSFTNSNGYDWLVVKLKFAIPVGITRSFSINVTGQINGTYTNIPNIKDRDGNILQYASNLTYKNAFRMENLFAGKVFQSATTAHKVLYIPITGVDIVRMRCEVGATTSGSDDFSVIGSYEAVQGELFTPKPNQRLISFNFTGDGTTKTFGASEARVVLPAGAKYVFAAITTYSGSNTLVSHLCEVSLGFQAISDNGSDFSAKDYCGNTTDTYEASYYATPWKEIKGDAVVCTLKFDTAPANGEHIRLLVYCVR